MTKKVLRFPVSFISSNGWRAVGGFKDTLLIHTYIPVATELGGPWGHVPPQNALRYPCHLGWSSYFGKI